MTTTIEARGGGVRAVGRGERVWDRLDGRWVRVAGVEPDGMVEVADDDGRVLPDLRHPTQLVAW